MSEKVFTTIRKWSAVIGLLLLLGTLGAGDLGRISLGAFIVQILIGLFLIFVDWVGLLPTNEEYPY